MDYKEFKQLIVSDAYRYVGKMSFKARVKLFLRTPGYNYTVKMRFANFCSGKGGKKILFPFAYLFYRKAMIKYGISIPYKTKIGYGFYVGHFGGIVVNSDVVIGNNVNISQGVTIGQAGEEGLKACPIIKDRVYIGPKATLVGNIDVGSDSAIGANAFVNKSVPDSVTVGGIPAMIISQKGSASYIHNTWNLEEK
jgi:serine O-acetyltransferase